MAKPKLNTSRAANTATKRVALTTTQPYTDLSQFPDLQSATAYSINAIREAFSLPTPSSFKKSTLVLELLNGLTLISQLAGNMGVTAYQTFLSNQLHTWPDTSLKKYRELQRRIITALESQNSKHPRTDSARRMSLAIPTASLEANSPTSIPRTTSSSLAAETSCLPRITTASSKKRIPRSFNKLSKRVKTRTKK